MVCAPLRVFAASREAEMWTRTVGALDQERNKKRSCANIIILTFCAGSLFRFDLINESKNFEFDRGLCRLEYFRKYSQAFHFA